jgi:death on curing protein
MIALEDILLLHKYSIEKYGGANGIRDTGALESAIARPFQTFGGEDLYPTVFEKAAALGESLIVNHPFVDGNKRTGFSAMVAFVMEEGYVLTAAQEEAYNLTIAISTNKHSFDEITNWLKANTRPL